MRLRRMEINTTQQIALLLQAALALTVYLMFNHLWGTRKAFYEDNKTLLNSIAQRSFQIQRDIPEDDWHVWDADTSYLIFYRNADRYLGYNAGSEELDFIEKNKLSIRVHRNSCVVIVFDSQDWLATVKLFTLKHVLPACNKTCGYGFNNVVHSEKVDSEWYYEEYVNSAE